MFCPNPVPLTQGMWTKTEKINLQSPARRLDRRLHGHRRNRRPDRGGNGSPDRRAGGAADHLRHVQGR